MNHETELLRKYLTSLGITWWRGYSKHSELTCWRDKFGRNFELSESLGDRCKLTISNADFKTIVELANLF